VDQRTEGGDPDDTVIPETFCLSEVDRRRIEVLLEPLGWLPLWHMTGPGRHGVDLVFLAPGDVVVAIEVKGTLVPGRVPRLSAGELVQMSAAWVDKVDNPGMVELDLASTDVYGGVAIVNLADLTWRAALTRDFLAFEPIAAREQLANLAWLVSTGAAGMERKTACQLFRASSSPPGPGALLAEPRFREGRSFTRGPARIQ
jgi:hypothetical protein